jgi:hypothetical protein
LITDLFEKGAAGGDQTDPRKTERHDLFREIQDPLCYREELFHCSSWNVTDVRAVQTKRHDHHG